MGKRVWKLDHTAKVNKADTPKYLDLLIVCGNCGYDWVEHIADIAKDQIPNGASCSMCGHSGKFDLR